MLLFFALLLVPLIEIALFVTVGGEIGTWPTLAIVVVTAIVGALAIRSQGRRTIAQMGRLRSPQEAGSAMLHGVFIAAAGLLLLTPGFLTDTIGLSLLVPPVRSFLINRAKKHAFASASIHMGAGRPGAGGPGHAQPNASGPEAEQDAEQHAPRMPVGKPMPDADDAVVLDDENKTGRR